GAWEVATWLFLLFSAEIKGVGGRREALLALFCRDQGRGWSPRGSSCSFLLRSGAGEGATRLVLLFSAEIEGAGGRHVAVRDLFCRALVHGRSPRCSSCSFLPRSRAWVVATSLFLLFSAEIGGVGGRHEALLSLFC